MIKIVLLTLGATVVALLVLALVGWLALRGPDIPYATLEAKYGERSSHFVDLPGGVRLHYRDEGDPNGFPPHAAYSPEGAFSVQIGRAHV